MRKYPVLGAAIAGLCAGCVTGLFGGGGGMLLIPLLSILSVVEESSLFSTSLCVMLPIVLVSIAGAALQGPLPWQQAFPYLISGAAGGLAAGLWGQKIPVLWLHRGLGLLVLWGGIRYLC